MWLIRFFLALSLFASYTFAQTNQPADHVAAVDPAIHESAVKLVDSIGMRQQILSHVDAMIASGRDAMVKAQPSLNTAFLDEWAKRMKERTNADDYVNVAVRVYEKYFSKDELDQLTQVSLDLKNSKTPQIPEALKTKLANTGTAVQSEIFGGCAQIGAKLGGDIGQEIQKEHPDWFTPTKRQ